MSSSTVFSVFKNTIGCFIQWKISETKIMYPVENDNLESILFKWLSENSAAILADGAMATAKANHRILKIENFQTKNKHQHGQSIK